MDPALRVHPDVHEARVPEHLEVLGHRRLCGAELLGKLADRTVPVEEKLEERASAGADEGGPDHIRCHTSEYIASGIFSYRHIAPTPARSNGRP